MWVILEINATNPFAHVIWLWANGLVESDLQKSSNLFEENEQKWSIY